MCSLIQDEEGRDAFDYCLPRSDHVIALLQAKSRTYHWEQRHKRMCVVIQCVLLRGNNVAGCSKVVDILCAMANGKRCTYAHLHCLHLFS